MMSPRLFAPLASLLVLSLQAEEPKGPPPGHDHAAHGSAQDNAAPPKPENFIVWEAEKTAHLTIVAAYNGANYGMNFNGFAKGGATCTIPEGWTVKVTFRNTSPVPHSAIVVEEGMVKKLQVGDPYFEGASTPNPLVGTTNKEETFTFTASETGDFAIACGFPTHAINGHWIKLIIDATAKAPSLQFGEDAPFLPKAP